MYFSLTPTPGYNLSYLKSHGIDGEWALFSGDLKLEDNGTEKVQKWVWGGENNSIKGILQFHENQK